MTNESIEVLGVLADAVEGAYMKLHTRPSIHFMEFVLEFHRQLEIEIKMIEEENKMNRAYQVEEPD